MYKRQVLQGDRLKKYIDGADYFVTKYRDELSGKEIDLLIINKTRTRS